MWWDARSDHPGSTPLTSSTADFSGAAPAAAARAAPIAGVLRRRAQEGGIESIKGWIRQSPNPPQRMVNWCPLLDRQVGEQGAATHLLTAHLGWPVEQFSRNLGFQQAPNETWALLPLKRNAFINEPVLLGQPLLRFWNAIRSKSF